MKRILQNMKTGFRDEGGQTLILVVMSLVALMGFAGLAIDVGNLRADEHKLQQAADAAAIAGALEISQCGTLTAGTACSKMTAASGMAMVENGMTLTGFSSTTPTSTNLYTDCATIPSTTTDLTLMVNWAPCLAGSKTADPNYGNSKVVEAQVAQTEGTYFASLFGLGTVRLSAHAEAGLVDSAYCVYVLNNGSTTGVLKVSSGGQFTAYCGVQDNGNLDEKGGSHIKSTLLDVAGTITGSSNQTQPTAVHAPQVADPMNILQSEEPAFSDPGSCGSFTYNGTTFVTSDSKTITITSSTISNGTASASILTGTPLSLNPGTYCGSIDLKSGGQLYLNNTTANNADGTNNGSMFVFDGNITAETNAGNGGSGTNCGGSSCTISGQNITMYFANQGNMTINNGNDVNLVAPSAGTYAGVLYFAPPTNTSTLTIDSGAKSVWQGIVYMPGGTVDENAGGNLAAYTMFLANQVDLAGGSKFTIGADYSSLQNGDPIKTTVALME